MKTQGLLYIPPDVRVVAVAGTNYNYASTLGIGYVLRWRLGFENDGFVTVESALSDHPINYTLDKNHTRIRTSLDTFSLVAPYLKPVELGGIPRAASVAQVTTPVVQAIGTLESETAEHVQIASILTGSVSSGEIQTRTLALEGDFASVGLDWGYADNMGLILIDPSSQRINPDSPPPNITYTASITDKTISYLIDSLQPGFWTAEITVTNPYTGGEKYWLTSIVSSTILMETSVDKNLYQPGDPILVQAAISDTNIPITGVIVTSTADLATLQLFDDGLHNDGTANDGLYANVFTDANQSGHYLFRVEASGTSGSIPFTRLAYTQAEVASKEAAFLDQYGETAVDENADHLYDTLVITTGVQLTSTGRYQIVGTLTTLTDTAIANAATILSDTAGSYQVPLSFDGALIAQSGLDGPYQLSDLYLLDISAGTHIQADYRDTAYTTTAYIASQFQRDVVALDSPITDEGVDTTSNGKYELLRVHVPLSVLNAGVYTVSVNLADSDGNGLTGFTRAYTLTGGVNTLPLDFNGPSISLLQTDGPYNVNGFIISRSPTETLEIPRLYTTGVYSYTDFESDTFPPTSAVDPLPTVITGTAFISVSWTGDDPEPSADIFYYDVQYKVSSEGIWTDWLTQTLLNSAQFGPTDPITVTSGETYYFQVRATDYADNQESYPGGDGDAHTTMLGVDLQVDKSTSTDFVQEHTADYSISYRNNGPFAAHDVVLTDTLPSGLSYVADTSGITPTVSDNTIAWSLGTVPPYADGAFSLTTYISPTLPGGSLITNTLNISTPDQESNYTNNSAVAGTTVQASTKDMYVSKGLDAGNATPGSNLTYEIYYRNYGTGSAADVVITDTLPVSTTYLSFSGPYTPTVLGNQVIWNLGAVPRSGSSGDRGSLYVSVHLSETIPVGTVLTNTAEIATSDTETNYANNMDTDVQTVFAGASDLQLDKYFESNFASPGSEVVYRLDYRNDSYDAAVGVTITDTLPMTVSYVSSTGAPEPSVVGDQVIWHLLSVPGKYQSGYEGNIYLTAYISDSVSVGTVLTNTVIITAANDTNPTNNSASDVRTVVAGVVQVSTGGDSDYDAALVMTAGGELVSVWQRNGELWTARSTDSGATWSVATQLAGCCRYQPAMLRMGDDSLWLVYRQNYDIWYRTSSDSGLTWSLEVQLTTHAAGDHYPDLAQTADGRIWVVWESDRSSGSNIWYKTTSDNGLSWTPDTEFPVDSGWNGNPTMAQAPDGTLWMVWFRGYGLAYSTSTDGGNTWSPLDFLDAGGPIHGPSLRRATDGTLWLAYPVTRYEAGQWRTNLYYRTSADSGGTWSGPRQFTFFVGENTELAIAPMNGGRVGLAWRSDRTGVAKVWFGIPGLREDIDPPPYVSSIEHAPSPNPDSGDSVTFRAWAQDETGVASVYLVWSLDSVAQPDLPMYDDGAHGDDAAGDGVYGMQHAPLPAGSQVTYRARATDTDGNTFLYPGENSFQVLEPFVKTADILSVPDYGGNSTDWFQPYFTNALDSLGYSYDIWDTGLRGAPDSATLDLYTSGVVIWASPDWGYFDDSDVRPDIEAYLDAGGKLFITGQNVAQNLDGTTLLSDYLHASYVQNDTNLYALNGTSGDPIGDELALGISGGDGANNQYDTDEIDPISPAVTVFTYDTAVTTALAEAVRPKVTRPERKGGKPGAVPTPAPWGKLQEPPEKPAEAEPTAGLQGIISSGTGGLRVDTGTYKVVFFSFGFEGINSQGNRAAVMERVLAWLRGVLPRPTQLSPADGSAVPIGDVNFTWSSVVGASGYQIQIDTTMAFTSTDLISDTVTSTSYTATLTLGTWFWRARALPDGLWTTAWEVRAAGPLVQVTTDLEWDYFPSIAQAADGTVWVVWISERSGNDDIWYKTSADSGTTWSVATRLTTDPDLDDTPAIIQTADGILWVAWSSWRSGNADIWYKTSADNGTTWSAASQLTTDPGDDYFPAITQAADGTLWVVWTSEWSDIWYKTSNDGGITWSADTQLTSTGTEWLPAITQTADGRLWVVWTSERASGEDIWYKTSINGGVTWSADTQLTSTGTEWLPAITQATDGTLWVVWTSERSGGEDIWYKTSNDGGVTWSASHQWTRFVGTDWLPAVVAMSDGSVAVAWSSDRAANEDIWFGIFGEHGDINPPPYVDHIEHQPSPNPYDDDTITIRGWAQDETGLSGAELLWGINGVGQANLPMHDDGAHDDGAAGDGQYGVQIAPLSAGSSVTYTVQVTDVDGNHYTYPWTHSLQVLEPFVKTADILFVPDYGGNSTDWFRPYFTNVMDDLGYGYDVWDTGLRGKVYSDTLNLYTDGVVIWAVPYWGYFDDSDVRPDIEAYLDAGGKLFMTGQDIAQDLNGTTLLSDYLHASYVQDNTGLYALNGTTDDPIGDGLTLGISGGDGAANQYDTDEIDPISPAVTVFTYDTTVVTALTKPIKPEVARPKREGGNRGAIPIPAPWREPQEPPRKPVETKSAADLQDIVSSGTGGLRVDTGTYKVVFFSFGFEAINPAADRQLVMERVLDWTWSLPGDLDFNCVVNVADIMRVANRWRMTDTDPDWNPRYDLNGDGIINIVDIMKVVAHWGETC